MGPSCSFLYLYPINPYHARSAPSIGIWHRQIRIQYGGSVTPENCKELIAKPNIDGFLVGAMDIESPCGGFQLAMGVPQ